MLENSLWFMGGILTGWVSGVLILWLLIKWHESKDPLDHD